MKKCNIKVGFGALCAVVGLILYIYTSTVGYLAGSAMSMLPVVATIGALLLLALRCKAGEKLPGIISDILLVAAGVLLIGSFAQFFMARVTLAADVYFIPVNYPASESTALHVSIAGFAAYLLSVLSVIVEAFTAKA